MPHPKQCQTPCFKLTTLLWPVFKANFHHYFWHSSFQKCLSNRPTLYSFCNAFLEPFLENLLPPRQCSLCLISGASIRVSFWTPKTSWRTICIMEKEGQIGRSFHSFSSGITWKDWPTEITLCGFITDSKNLPMRLCGPRGRWIRITLGKVATRHTQHSDVTWPNFSPIFTRVLYDHTIIFSDVIIFQSREMRRNDKPSRSHIAG